MQKWEYLNFEQERAYSSELTDLIPQINLQNLGDEGWEQVGILPLAGASGSNFAGITTVVRWVFKRP